VIALLAPGQGSQTEGMLSPWLELPGAADRLSSWSAASGLDLARLGTTASTEEITNTAIAQPLIVAATLLAYQELTTRGLLADEERVVAGHSVGEIAAYAIAGVLSADDAVALAATRGAEMAKACANEPTGMSAVLGGDEAEVLARLEQLDLVAANRNAAGCARWASPAPSTPSSWPRPWMATPRRRRMSRPPSRPPLCCRTATASR
jgi:[acyl-carrier-protein] S-malonyltransferase